MSTSLDSHTYLESFTHSEEGESFDSGMEVPETKRGSPLFPCRHCDIFFGKKHYWYKHVIREHGRGEKELNKDVTYACSTCAKMFQHEKSRDAHLRTHRYRAKYSTNTMAKPAEVIAYRRKLSF